MPRNTGGWEHWDSRVLITAHFMNLRGCRFVCDRGLKQYKSFERVPLSPMFHWILASTLNSPPTTTHHDHQPPSPPPATIELLNQFDENKAQTHRRAAEQRLSMTKFAYLNTGYSHVLHSNALTNRLVSMLYAAAVVKKNIRGVRGCAHMVDAPQATQVWVFFPLVTWHLGDSLSHESTSLGHTCIAISAQDRFLIARVQACFKSMTDEDQDLLRDIISEYGAFLTHSASQMKAAFSPTVLFVVEMLSKMRSQMASRIVGRGLWRRLVKSPSLSCSAGDVLAAWLAELPDDFGFL